MAIAISGSDVLARAAMRMHLPTPAAGEFLTAAQGLMMVQDACERLSAMLIRSFGDDYGVLIDTFTTQVGVEILSLPPNVASVRALFWIDANDCAHRMLHAEAKDWQPKVQKWSAADTGHCYPRYRLQNNVISFQPIPAEVYTLRLEYSAPILIQDITDTIFGAAGWREWLVCDVCEQISDREDKDPTRFTLRKGVIEAELRAEAQQRDRFVPQQVVDERGAMRRNPRLSFGAWPRWRGWGGY